MNTASSVTLGSLDFGLMLEGMVRSTSREPGQCFFPTKNSTRHLNAIMVSLHYIYMLLRMCHLVSSLIYLVVSPYEILRSNIGFINHAVSGSGQPTIVIVSSHLLQQRLISLADHEAVVTPSGLPPSQVVAQLMILVMNQIRYVPEHVPELSHCFEKS